MKGADKIEAAVAAATPGFSPSPRKKEKPKRIPNLGTRLKPTPTNRGPYTTHTSAKRMCENTASAS